MKTPIFPGKYHQNGGFSMGYVSFREGNSHVVGRFFNAELLNLVAGAPRKKKIENNTPKQLGLTSERLRIRVQGRT